MGKPSNQMVDFPACTTFDDYRRFFFLSDIHQHNKNTTKKHLVGGFNMFLPSWKNEFVNGKDDIPYMEWKIIHSCSQPPTRNMILSLQSMIWRLQTSLQMSLGPFLDARYPLVNIQKTMENHHFQWVNLRTKWPCSIVFCMFSRGYHQWINITSPFCHNFGQALFKLFFRLSSCRCYLPFCRQITITSTTIYHYITTHHAIVSPVYLQFYRKFSPASGHRNCLLPHRLVTPSYVC